MHFLLFLAMIWVVGQASSFLMTKVNPAVLVEEGSSMHLVCSADDDYEYCTFTSPDNKECHFEWKRHLGGIKMQECPNKKRISFNGVYKQKQCGITVKGVTQADSGFWKCSLEDYIFAGKKGSGKNVHGDINVTVIGKLTTTSVRTTTTHKFSTTPTGTHTSTNNTIIGRFGDDAEEAKKNSSNPGLIGGLVVLLILAVFSLIAVALYYYQKNKNEKMKGDGINYLTIVNNEFEE